MLEYNPLLRISAQDAIAHYWIKEYEDLDALDPDMIKDCLIQLSKFNP